MGGLQFVQVIKLVQLELLSEYCLNFEHKWLKELDKESIPLRTCMEIVWSWYGVHAECGRSCEDPAVLQLSAPGGLLSQRFSLHRERHHRQIRAIAPDDRSASGKQVHQSMGKDIVTDFDAKVYKMHLRWILLENIGLKWFELGSCAGAHSQQQKVRDGSGFTIKLGDKSINYASQRSKGLLDLDDDDLAVQSVGQLQDFCWKQFTARFVRFVGSDAGNRCCKGKTQLSFEEHKSQLVKDNAKMNKQLKEIEDIKLQCVELGDIDLRSVWQVWDLATWTFVLCGRCGTCGTGLGRVTRLGPLGRL
eukprot:s407_g3.t1